MISSRAQGCKSIPCYSARKRPALPVCPAWGRRAIFEHHMTAKTQIDSALKADAHEHALAQLRRAGTMRIGTEGYARIIGSLNDGPKSVSSLQRLHPTVSRLTILAIMRHGLRAGIVHRKAWYRPAPHARMVPVFALGADGDISMPQYEERARNPRRAPSALMLLTTIMRLVGEYPRSRAELRDELKMHTATIERVVSLMRRHHLIHIASWDKRPIGTTVAELGLGNKRDAPRPARVSEMPGYWRGFEQKQRTTAMCHRLAGNADAFLAADESSGTAVAGRSVGAA